MLLLRSALVWSYCKYKLTCDQVFKSNGEVCKFKGCVNNHRPKDNNEEQSAKLHLHTNDNSSQLNQFILNYMLDIRLRKRT